MSAENARDVVGEFNHAISSRDLFRLEQLMTEDHIRITGDAEPIEGREACLIAWREFFNILPDYRNVFERVWSVGPVVWMSGRAVSTDERLNGPAMWKAIVDGPRVREWHVEEDTPEGRRRLGHEPSGD